MRKKKIIFSSFLIIMFLFMLNIFSLTFPGKLRLIDQPRQYLTKTFIDVLDTCDMKLALIHPDINNRYTRNGIPFTILSETLDSIPPGTIIFSSHGKSICSLIPGKWKHAMVYIGTKSQLMQFLGTETDKYRFLFSYYKNGDEYLILDSRLHQGVHIHDIRDLADLRTSSTMRKMVYFIPKNKDILSISIMNFVFGELGKKYDLDFDLNNDTYYCSELIYHTLIKTTQSTPIPVDKFPKTIISPSDAYFFAKEINNKKDLFTTREIESSVKN